MRRIDLHLEDRLIKDGALHAAVTLELSPERRENLWYRIPEDHQESLSDDVDGFVTALALRFAAEGKDVRVHGRVSPSLLRNLESYQAAWQAWVPGLYNRVMITADEERERPAPDGPAQAVCGFSGGVDSSFTAYRHSRGLTTRFPQPLRAGLMVKGFDIPLEQEGMFQRAAEKAKRQLDSLGLEIIPVATNFKELNVKWIHTFGPAVAGLLMLFGNRFCRGLVAQGVPFSSYRHLVEGSNPLTDPLLSSEAFRVLPDGAEFTRPEKIHVLADWPEALEELRVCWRGLEKDRNCCECEKCIRNILTFRVLGFGLPPCFEHDVTDQQILNLGPLKEIIISVGYEPIIRMAEKAGNGEESWVKALRKAIARNRRTARLRATPVLRRIPAVAHRVKSMVPFVFRGTSEG